jgi:uncharacterized membrane protein YbhN (UPF0104 family)
VMPVPSAHTSRLLGLLGLGLLAGLIVAALRFSEGRDFVRLVEEARPSWFLLALLFQAATYAAQGETWRAVARACHYPLSMRSGWQLSLAKLFVDQTLPTAGLSGTIVVARVLERQGMPRAAVMAGVVVATVSNQAAVVVTLAVALTVAAVHGEATALVVVASVIVLLLGVALAASVLVLSGRGVKGRARRGLARIPGVRTALQALSEADPRLARRPSLLLEAGACQMAAVLLDSATLWALLRAMGVPAAPTGVFVSFVIASVFRTIGILPGGLGTFDAASVLALRGTGVPIAAALSATLLFRGLSSWLPMLPGWWMSRRLLVGHG